MPRYVALILLLIAPVGCTTVRVTDPAKTATEQFLTSVAATNAVAEISAEALRGRLVFVDELYFPVKDHAFTLAELRAHLLLAGARVTPKREEAEIIVEPRTGGIGIDRYEFLLGIPSVPLGAVLTGAGMPGSTALSTPELAIIKNTRQWGTASIAYVAYWSDTGEIVSSSGPEIGRSYREDWWFFGWGPSSVSNIPPTQPLE
jgi:hypothetical protein